jgi:nucleotide-binding universal stress UspA family protein
MTRTEREAATAKTGPRSVLLGLVAQSSFAETAALRFATELAVNSGACLSLCVFPPAVAIRAGEAVGKADRYHAPLASETLHGAGRLVARAGVELIAEHTASEPRTRFAQLARVHDVTVLDTAASSTQGREAIEDALFDSGRPVLVVPQHGGRATPRRIAIAWDGSARAARAVADALPFLRSADTVIAVTIAGEKDLSRMAPGADLATYLTRQGVPDCKLANLAAKRAVIAARLRLFASEEDVDMIVMGAFVHSRFREAVLGGVTRSLLDDTPVPLFMSH